MEAENDFSRKSKKYRTKYLDELAKLWGKVKDDHGNGKEGVKIDHSETIEGKGTSV